MESLNSGDMLHLYARPEAVHHTADRSLLEVRVVSNMEPKMEQAVLASRLGLPPENVVRVDDSKDPGARLVVGFRKWRSSWDPHAPKIDPNLN